MRLSIVPGVLALACATLAGCDQAPPQTTAPGPQACNCQPAPPAPPSVLPPAPPPAGEPVNAYRHHRYAHHERYEGYSEYSYSESETSTYGYVSDSHREGGYAGGGSYYEAGGSAGAYPSGRLWIDGYGRAYSANRPARASGTMTRTRLKPWAHYDEDCPER